MRDRENLRFERTRLFGRVRRIFLALGARLVEAAVEAARASGASGVLLVGDQGFFGRLGFACIDGPVMPGPVDPARLFWMGFGGEAPAGPVLPA